MAMLLLRLVNAVIHGLVVAAIKVYDLQYSQGLLENSSWLTESYSLLI